MTLYRPAVPVVVAALLAAGCSWFGGSKSTEYQGAAARAGKPLEVPPELTAPTTDDRFAVPDPRAQTTYSQYSQRPAGPAASAPGTPMVLPPIQSARIERGGDQRWLVVKGEPDKVWVVAREFWLDAGYTLVRESPEVGIMETDWKEDRSKIPDDIIRRTIGRVIEGMYSTPRRDKFRTRLEKGAEPGTTEVFVSNRSVEEVYTSSTQDVTKWVARPADRDLEAEMLARLMVKMGAAEHTAAAPKPAAPVPGARPTAVSQAPANAVLENAGAGPLVVNDGFDRAWRRVGLALDRVGFTVEDRDRSKGVFFVRYIDPEADRQNTKNESWTDKLMFWKSPPKAPQPQYRIVVADSGAGLSQVQVQNAQGAVETSSTGKRILSLLYEQLK